MSIYQQICRFDAVTKEMVAVPIITSGAAWPTGDPFVFAPGIYVFNGVAYDMTVEGYYCVFAEATSGPAYGAGESHCVYQSNIIELVRAIMSQTTFGDLDHAALTAMGGKASLYALMRLRKIALLCGDTVALTQYVLNLFGIESRLCHVLEKGLPTGVVDGHQPMEIKIGARWQLFDICLKTAWPDTINGGYQSLDAIIEAGVCNLVPEEMVQPTSQPENWTGTGFNDDEWWTLFCLTPAARMQARNRLYQIPGIDAADGMSYFYMPAGTESDEAWLLSLSPTYRVLSYTDWKAKFYQ